MSHQTIQWIEPNQKYANSLVFGSIVFLILGLVALPFGSIDIGFTFVVTALGCFVLYLTFRAYWSYNLGLSDDFLYVKKYGKDFLSQEWENIMHDGNTLVIQGFKIIFKPYSGNDYGSETYAKDSVPFGFDEKSIIVLLTKLKSSKKISTQELQDMKENDAVDKKTVLLVFVLVVILFGSYIIYVT